MGAIWQSTSEPGVDKMSKRFGFVLLVGENLWPAILISCLGQRGAALNQADAASDNIQTSSFTLVYIRHSSNLYKAKVMAVKTRMSDGRQLEI
ncbi:hypothetical protein RRG08_031188 [Elysia crispata]|uniref:Uncharacterized protein n=1 Tax=Elysia crispata TaxID=231223 RepID=A0AAE0ZFV0_9GAST|nr:hypothetical protein RRG08_031188 [Elysia crispata]